MEKLFIPVILGTAREGRRSEAAAKYMLEQVKQAGLETELIDVRDFLHRATQETFPGQEELGEKLKRADGYVVVSPEYNHSFPGELKLFLDTFYQEYARKPVGICGVSIGPNGGVRAVEQLRLVFIEFHAVPIREAVYFRNAIDLFDERGQIKDQGYEKFAKTFLEEFVWFANALKTARS